MPRLLSCLRARSRRSCLWGHSPARAIPIRAIEALDPRFRARIGNAAIERIATGYRWAEGPVYVRDGGYLLWSDIPNNRIMRWSEDDGHVSVFRSPSNYSNGNTRDREGRLITCEHDTRRVTRTEPDGTITVLIDRFEGKRLNAPNDAVVTADGAIWFTDPGYGILGNYEGHWIRSNCRRRSIASTRGADARRSPREISAGPTASRSRPTSGSST